MCSCGGYSRTVWCELKVDSAPFVGLTREVAIANSVLIELTHKGAEVCCFTDHFFGPNVEHLILDNECFANGESLTLCRAIIVEAVTNA